MRRGLASVLAAVAATALTPTARAEVLDDNPAAASRGARPGHRAGPRRRRHAPGLGAPGGAFTPWQSLGGYLDSGPGAVGRTAQNTDGFVRGGDGALYQKSYVVGSGWTGWYRLGHSMLSAPATSVRRGSGILDIFWRGADNGIEVKSWVPS